MVFQDGIYNSRNNIRFCAGVKICLSH